MEIVVAIGVLTASGVWLILRPRTFQIIVGLSLLSYAVNLFIYAMGRLQVDAPPIVSGGAAADPSQHVDPPDQEPLRGASAGHLRLMTTLILAWSFTAAQVMLGLAMGFAA